MQQATGWKWLLSRKLNKHRSAQGRHAYWIYCIWKRIKSKVAGLNCWYSIGTSLFYYTLQFFLSYLARQWRLARLFMSDALPVVTVWLSLPWPMCILLPSSIAMQLSQSHCNAFLRANCSGQNFRGENLNVKENKGRIILNESMLCWNMFARTAQHGTRVCDIVIKHYYDVQLYLNIVFSV